MLLGKVGSSPGAPACSQKSCGTAWRGEPTSRHCCAHHGTKLAMLTVLYSPGMHAALSSLELLQGNDGPCSQLHVSSDCSWANVC
jgi:hypothetical protein